MKILSLGAHDGYLDAWLRERYDGDLKIDGLELNPEAAEKARERGVNCRIGRAEEAPFHFEAGSYDAVVAFELIEHVPDVDELLDVAEHMVKPGGQVLVSSPDGTFGEGGNPHHLRVYRSVDLADLLRRRGTLCDMIPGHGDLGADLPKADGVAAAAYTPAGPRPRLGDIAIYCGRGLASWAASDIATRGLGGSETAAVRLADELWQLGYVVTIYSETPFNRETQTYEHEVFRNVILKHWSTFDPMEKRLAVISSRWPEVFAGDPPPRAEKRLLWLHDVDAGDRLTPEIAERIDHVLALSEWHEKHVYGLYPFLTWGAGRKVRRIRNGVHLPFFNGPAPERKQRVLYTSSPDRGLDILLELWPQVLERVPDAELCYLYAPVYQEIAERDPIIGAHAALVRELSNQPGVRSLGSLPQKELARLMRSSMVWCAPSWNTPGNQPFYETSCIGAMEAQAAGCHVVASAWGALPETVRVGSLVNPDKDWIGEEWRKWFVHHIVGGLTNPEFRRDAQTDGPQVVSDLGWDGVAKQVAELLR